MAKKSIIGIAKSENQAVRIVEDLRATGFSGNDISVLFPDKEELAAAKKRMGLR